MRCSACGTENRDEARFCDGCGGRLEATPAVVAARLDRRSMTASTVETTFQLSASTQDPPIDVRLRLLGGRWVAIAEISGRSAIGLGRTAREALTAAFGSVTVDTRRALLADATLFAPRLAVRRAAASTTGAVT
jgi:hypothetical protein